MKQEVKSECAETKVKEMGDDELLALNQAVGLGGVGTEYAEIVGREMHSRNLAGSQGVGPPVPVKDDKGE